MELPYVTYVCVFTLFSLLAITVYILIWICLCFSTRQTLSRASFSHAVWHTGACVSLQEGGGSVIKREPGAWPLACVTLVTRDVMDMHTSSHRWLWWVGTHIRHLLFIFTSSLSLHFTRNISLSSAASVIHLLTLSVSCFLTHSQLDNQVKTSLKRQLV